MNSEPIKIGPTNLPKLGPKEEKVAKKLTPSNKPSGKWKVFETGKEYKDYCKHRKIRRKIADKSKKRNRRKG